MQWNQFFFFFLNLQLIKWKWHSNLPFYINRRHKKKQIKLRIMSSEETQELNQLSGRWFFFFVFFWLFLLANFISWWILIRIQELLPLVQFQFASVILKVHKLRYTSFTFFPIFFKFIYMRWYKQYDLKTFCEIKPKFLKIIYIFICNLLSLRCFIHFIKNTLLLLLTSHWEILLHLI